MKIRERKETQTLGTETIFDPFSTELIFEKVTRRKLHYLLPLWKDLDVSFNNEDGQSYCARFNIHQLERLVHECQRLMPQTDELKQLESIWAAHQLYWRGASFELNLTTEPIIYSILNTSPDSFYDGGELKDMDAVLDRAEADVMAGAKVLELGGQTTKPGFKPIEASEEISRVVPQLRAIKQRFPDIPLAVDTYKTDVMDAALNAGADIINDVNGFRDDMKKLDLVKEFEPAVVTMHENRGHPYMEDLTTNIRRFFSKNLKMFLEAGIPYCSIALDQGIGYSANPDNLQDFAFMRTIGQLNQFNRPTMVAVSNKGFFSKLLDVDKTERLTPTLICEAAMIHEGGRIIRVHDVAATAKMMKLVQAMDTSFLVDKTEDAIKGSEVLKDVDPDDDDDGDLPLG